MARLNMQLKGKMVSLLSSLCQTPSSYNRLLAAYPEMNPLLRNPTYASLSPAFSLNVCHSNTSITAL